MRKLKFLLADKSEIFLKGLANILSLEPDVCKVDICHSGPEAIETATKNKPDIIITDIDLDGCTGIEVIKQASEILPNAIFIVLTRSVAYKNFISAFKAGARAYMWKDIDAEKLVSSTKLVANGEIIISPPMATKVIEAFKCLDDINDEGRLKYTILLSKRERSILPLVEQGLTNKKIASTLSISEHTVKVHLRNIMEKLHAHTRQEAVSLAVEKKLLIELSR
jgi:DNA-binding NarL/FixJ family response regulator